MKTLIAAAAAVLALATVGPLAAQEKKIDKDAPPPSVQTIPIILGEVTGVTSHTVTVRTTRGESMTFETDSRTVMPSYMTTGKRVKIEHRLMGNGAHHAGRITVIEPGSFDWERYDEELAMYPVTRTEDTRARAEYEREAPAAADDRDVLASGSTAYDADRTRDDVRSDEARAADNRVVSGNDGRVDRETREEELPRTASRQPLMLLVGLGAIAAAASIALSRRRRSI